MHAGRPTRSWGLPIAWRIALPPAVAITLGLAFVGFAATWWFERVLVQDLDRAMDAELSRVVERVVGSPASEGLGALFDVADEERGRPQIDVSILRDDDSLAAANGERARSRLGARRAVLEGLGPRVPRQEGEGGVAMRALSEVVVVGEERLLVRVAASMDPVSARIAFVRRVHGGSLAVALPAFTLLGLWLASRALRPVDRMRREADRISRDNLGVRLPVSPRDDEIDRLATTLNDALDRVGASIASIEHFTANAAHELRTPLAAARSTLESALLRARPDDPVLIHEAAETSLDELDRLARIVDELLTLSRLQSGRAEVLRERVDLTEIVADRCDLFAPLAESVGVRLETSAEGAAPTRGSRVLIERALENLMENALAVTPAGGHVSVTVAAASDQCRLRVVDTGPGLPPEERLRVFERFYRRPGTSARGTGLGLAIVRSIAEVHGGSITCSEAPTGGCVFTLTLPRSAS